MYESLIEIYDSRFPTSLPVAPIAIEATVVGSSGIPPNPSLETGRGKEKNLEKWRLQFLVLQETGTRLEKEQEEEKIAQVFFQKIRSHEEGNTEAADHQLENITKLGENWD